MSGKWIVRINDKDFSAPDLDALRAWAREGRVQPSHYVFNPTLERWFYAREIEELNGHFGTRPTQVTTSQMGWLIAVLCIIVGFLLLSALVSFFKSPTRTTPSREPTYSVSADELFRDYRANEVAADARYKGNVVVVSGTIQSIGKDILGTPYIVIGGSGFLNGVQCMFPRSAEPTVARFYKGQSVTVRGRVSGKMGNVLVNDAALQ